MKKPAGSVEARPADMAKFAGAESVKTGWTPAHPGAKKFRTHDLVKVSADRIELRPAAAVKAVCWILLAAGAVVTAGFVLYLVRTRVATLGPELFMVGVAGVTLVAVGWGMLGLELKTIVFDMRQGSFSKGKEARRLEEVHALQILSKRFAGENLSYDSHELNLVLGDGKRVNVLDHGDLPALRVAASAISDLLGKPVWDAAGT